MSTEAFSNFNLKDVIGGASMGMKTYAAFSGASADRASAAATKHGLEFNAAVERNNATMRDWQAQQAVSRGQHVAAKIGTDARRLMGTQRAALAGRGLALDQGSPLAIMMDVQHGAATDIAMATDNANKEAGGFRVEGSNARARAGMYDSQASAINPNASYRNGLLTRGAGVAESWFKIAGAPGASSTPPKKQAPRDPFLEEF